MAVTSRGGDPAVIRQTISLVIQTPAQFNFQRDNRVLARCEHTRVDKLLHLLTVCIRSLSLVSLWVFLFFSCFCPSASFSRSSTSPSSRSLLSPPASRVCLLGRWVRNDLLTTVWLFFTSPLSQKIFRILILEFCSGVIHTGVILSNYFSTVQLGVFFCSLSWCSREWINQQSYSKILIVAVKAQTHLLLAISIYC